VRSAAVVLRGFVDLPLFAQGQHYVFYLSYTTGGGGSVSLHHVRHTEVMATQRLSTTFSTHLYKQRLTAQGRWSSTPRAWGIQGSGAGSGTGSGAAAARAMGEAGKDESSEDGLDMICLTWLHGTPECTAMHPPECPAKYAALSSDVSNESTSASLVGCQSIAR